MEAIARYVQALGGHLQISPCSAMTCTSCAAPTPTPHNSNHLLRPHHATLRGTSPGRAWLPAFQSWELPINSGSSSMWSSFRWRCFIGRGLIGHPTLLQRPVFAFHPQSSAWLVISSSSRLRHAGPDSRGSSRRSRVHTPGDLPPRLLALPAHDSLTPGGWSGFPCGGRPSTPAMSSPLRGGQGYRDGAPGLSAASPAYLTHRPRGLTAAVGGAVLCRSACPAVRAWAARPRPAEEPQRGQRPPDARRAA